MNMTKHYYTAKLRRKIQVSQLEGVESILDEEKKRRDEESTTEIK